jgi:hypothetical protein
MSQELDFENRELCPDGSCIGVIGPDGRCKVCGRPGSSDGRGPYRASPGRQEDDGEEDDLDAAEAAAAGDDEPAFDEDRELCPDGSCIGVIGPDGRCSVCGAEGASSPAGSGSGP